MPTPESLAQRYEAVLQSYTEHRDLISATRLAALNDLLPDLATELGWEDDQLERSRVFLDDAGSSRRSLETGSGAERTAQSISIGSSGEHVSTVTAPSPCSVLPSHGAPLRPSTPSPLPPWSRNTSTARSSTSTAA
jgi:hypothetical protein